MHWHQKETQQLFEDLNTSSLGLNSEEVRQKLAEYGPNELKEKKGSNLLLFVKIFLTKDSILYLVTDR
jgi:magnesium-transporting ATPase (P-type)